MFSELEKLGREQEVPVDSTPVWMDNGDDANDEAVDPWEEERTWRDPSAHKFRGVVVKWIDEDYAYTELIKVS